MSIDRHDPLSGAAPVSVNLPRAPLVRVMVQLVFNPIAKIANPDLPAVSDFQDKIRGMFPKFRRDDGQVFDFTVDANQVSFQSTASAVWLFFDSVDNYRVTLTADRLTLEAAPNCYGGRGVFLEQFKGLVDAFVEAFPDVSGVGVGYRYVSQCKDELILDNLNDYIENELIGIVAASAGWRQNIESTLSRVSAKTDEGQASWQWGLIPEGQTHDPLVMQPFNERSWVLDIDSTRAIEANDSLNSDAIMKSLGEVSNRAYAIFRWCVKTSFLEFYGRDV